MPRQFRRYQLKKDAVRIVGTGHPWIYRSHLGSAADSFADGDWVRFVDADNRIVGYGRYEKEGLVAARVYRKGATPPDAAWVRAQVEKALARRKALRNYSTGFRAVHGENDGLPGVVIDIYGEYAVLQTYSRAADAVGRYVAAVVRQLVPVRGVLWKIPAKRKGGRSDKSGHTRVLWGSVPAETSWQEGQVTFWAGIGEGQKSGAFLDLRSLRKWLATSGAVKGRVLNLFGYTGTLALAAETGGAKETWSVDIAAPALAYAKKRHAKDPSKHRYIEADVFSWLADLAPEALFEGVIVDPPQMASETRQVPKALATYKRLYREAGSHVKPGGWLIGACCTGRIEALEFERAATAGLGQGFRIEKRFGPEDDHPVGFPEGAYLKVVLFRRGTAPAQRATPPPRRSSPRR